MTEYTILPVAARACADQRWQEIGAASSLQEFQHRGKTECRVGLDFGTAFTKACIQFRESAFVVHWDKAVLSDLPFLLPGVFTVLLDGTCVLGTASGGRLQSDLKMALLSGANAESKINATAFLALATRYVRSWLFSQHGNVFSGFELEWFVNVGLPTVQWDDLDLGRIYQSIALAGWRLGAVPGPITISNAASFLSSIQANTPATSEQLQEGKVKTIPEYVAQIHSYRQSPQRRRDLHLLVDVGAGTVDIVTFHVWEPEETDCYSTLEATVERLGTHMLLGYRAQAGNVKRSTWDESAARLQTRQFESTFGLSVGTLRPAQALFADQLYLALQKLLRATKARRYETSPAWSEGVPFFLSGGARDVDIYKEAIAIVETDWRLIKMDLPMPETLVAGKVTRQAFHRVSVAHGLSYSADNLGQIERKSEVADLQRPRSTRVDYTPPDT